MQLVRVMAASDTFLRVKTVSYILSGPKIKKTLGEI